MNKLEISSIIYYGRDYRENDGGYYVDLTDFSIYAENEMTEKFGFTSSDLKDGNRLKDDHNFAPLFKVDIVNEMRIFLNRLNDRRLSEKIREYNEEQLYIYFQKHIEVNNGDRQRWHEHEKQCLTKSAVEWCEGLNIPYSL